MPAQDFLALYRKLTDSLIAFNRIGGDVSCFDDSIATILPGSRR